MSTTPTHDAAQHINALLSEHQHEDVLLLLSGGSALSLVDLIDTTLLSERTTLSVLDERYTQDQTTSNTTQLTHTAFWERAQKQHVQVIDPRPDEDESLEASAQRFDVALKYWHITHRNGIGIATMGVGVDGHTAGILPHPHTQELFDSQFAKEHRCVVGYESDTSTAHTKRITTTMFYLTRHIHHAVVYVTGTEKQQALTALMQESGTTDATPARILRDMRDVHLYTDIILP